MCAAIHDYDSLIVMLLSANADGNLKNVVSVCICCCCMCSYVCLSFCLSVVFLSFCLFVFLSVCCRSFIVNIKANTVNVISL